MAFQSVFSACVETLAQAGQMVRVHAGAAPREVSGYFRPFGWVILITHTVLNCPHINRQATFDCFLEVLKQVLEGVSLRCAAGEGGNLGPVSTFFSLMHDDLDLHGRIIHPKKLTGGTGVAMGGWARAAYALCRILNY
jgi:hypothetical protein